MACEDFERAVEHAIQEINKRLDRIADDLKRSREKEEVPEKPVFYGGWPSEDCGGAL